LGNLVIVQLLQQHGVTLHGWHMVKALSQGAEKKRKEKKRKSQCFTVQITLHEGYTVPFS
jgi:hypothetical protein